MTMKNKIWLALLLLVALVGLTMSFIGKNNNTATEMSEFPASYGIYEYTWTTDTITDAESDTLTISPLLLSDWDANYTITVDSLSGTPIIAVALQESNKRSGDEWYFWGTSSNSNDMSVGAVISGIGSTTYVRAINGAFASSSSGLDYIFPLKVHGVRQRIIITGVGTQSTKYSVKVTLKKST